MDPHTPAFATWPAVFLLLIDRLPTIITAFGAIVAAWYAAKIRTTGQNTNEVVHSSAQAIKAGVEGVEMVKEQTNGKFAKLEELLRQAVIDKETALAEIRALKITNEITNEIRRAAPELPSQVAHYDDLDKGPRS